MRRRAGELLSIEIDILEVAVETAAAGDGWIHGFAMAKELQAASGAKRLTAHGTLYKALGRLADSGLLEHRWEDADAALADGRPRRRLYRITPSGRQALAAAERAPGDAASRPAPRIAPA
jgi:DNA-binding PadR family transcriptional regulator